MHTNMHAHTHTCHTHIQSVQLLRSVTDLGLVLAVFKLFTLLGKYVRISPVAVNSKAVWLTCILKLVCSCVINSLFCKWYIHTSAYSLKFKTHSTWISLTSYVWAVTSL